MLVEMVICKNQNLSFKNDKRSSYFVSITPSYISSNLSNYNIKNQRTHTHIIKLQQKNIFSRLFVHQKIKLYYKLMPTLISIKA